MSNFRNNTERSRNSSPLLFGEQEKAAFEGLI